MNGTWQVGVRGRPHRRGVAVVAFAAVAICAGVATARGAGAVADSGTSAEAANPAPPRTLGGVWRLDPKRSEALRDKLPRPAEGGPPGGMGGPPGGMGGRPPAGGGAGGMRGGPPGGGRGAGEGGPGSALMQELANPPLVMLIEDLDSLFILSERGDTRQVLVLGDPVLAQSTYPDAPHVAARWRGRKLVSEVVGPRGGTFRTEYELSGDGTTLRVKHALDGPDGRGGLDLERVYVRYEGDD